MRLIVNLTPLNRINSRTGTRLKLCSSLQNLLQLMWIVYLFNRSFVILFPGFGWVNKANCPEHKKICWFCWFFPVVFPLLNSIGKIYITFFFFVIFFCIEKSTFHFKKIGNIFMENLHFPIQFLYKIYNKSNYFVVFF